MGEGMEERDGGWDGRGVEGEVGLGGRGRGWERGGGRGWERGFGRNRWEGRKEHGKG